MRWQRVDSPTTTTVSELVRITPKRFQTRAYHRVCCYMRIVIVIDGVKRKKTVKERIADVLDYSSFFYVYAFVVVMQLPYP